MINYKKIFKSRELRIKLMYILSFMPDSYIVKLQYRIKTGRKLNLKSPQRFTEKLQWYKLYYRNPLMSKCVDKYAVRNYVKECGCGEILIPIIGIYKRVEEISFDKLPNQFVLKDTLGGGGTSVIICNDKENFDWSSAKIKLDTWVNKKKGKHPGREWVYDDQRSRILVESYVDSNPEEGGLIDYKFFCFNGRVECIYGISDRTMGSGAGLGIYDRHFNLLKYRRADERPLERVIKKPSNYDEMVEYAELLSSKFPHARIDLYNQDGRILFGEITFFDGSGYMEFDPDEFDYKLGRSFKLP